MLCVRLSLQSASVGVGLCTTAGADSAGAIRARAGKILACSAHEPEHRVLGSDVRCTLRSRARRGGGGSQFSNEVVMDQNT